MSEMGDAIKELMEAKKLSKESVKLTVEEMLKAAYKRTYGTDDNTHVVFDDDDNGIPYDVTLYARKEVVDGGDDPFDVYDPASEIPFGLARTLDPECEIGDELDIPYDPKEFERSAVSTGKQKAHQNIKERHKTTLYDEYKDRVGQIVTGYYQRERNGTIYVDFGNIEGVLPLKYQSPAEKNRYERGDRIRALVKEITKNNVGVQLILSRTDPELVRHLLEAEVPEISDGTIEIYKIVREAGSRSKIAVVSQREDIDPVGACVGLKGVRIQSVIHELFGEKIDVLKYDPNPVEFIKNALSPAEVVKVFITDEKLKQALAVTEDSQFSLAIGKGGLNVRLANRLCDWSIDVKTEAQADELDLSDTASRQAAHELFSDEAGDGSGGEEITVIAEVPGVDERVADLLKAAGLEDVRKFVENYETLKEQGVEGVSKEEIERVYSLINETVEFVEEKKDEAVVEEAASSDSVGEAAVQADEEEEEYFCPECGAKITLDMTHCPQCGVEFEFQEDEE